MPSVTMSPSTGPEGISLHAVIFIMLRKVESTSDVNRGPEPCQSVTALTFPVLCLAYARVVSQIDGAVQAHAHDDHYLTRSKFNSLLTEMITPQTYKYINTSGDENHLCGASLRKSHKISLKAHRHACHGNS